MATLYGEVWLALAGALVIYCIALVKAWHHRRALIGLLNPLNEDPFGGVITTDIEVVVSMANGRQTVAYGDHIKAGTIFDGQRSLDINDGENPYTVNVKGLDAALMRDERSRPEILRLPSMTRKAALAETNCEAWLYARVAFLYFLVMMICWIPASINRLVSLINPFGVIFALNYIAIIFLPLQGFLNALVYCVSSQTGVRNLLRLDMVSGGGHAKPKDAERILDDSDLHNNNKNGALVFKDGSSADHTPTTTTTTTNTNAGPPTDSNHFQMTRPVARPQAAHADDGGEPDSGQRNDSVTFGIGRAG